MSKLRHKSAGMLHIGAMSTSAEHAGSRIIKSYTAIAIALEFIQLAISQII